MLLSYGIFVNPDAVIRTVYHKYHHPKEVLISNGVVNREIARVVRLHKLIVVVGIECLVLLINVKF